MTKALRKVIRAERLRTIRTWCLTLGGIVLLMAFSMAMGGGSGGQNPKTSTSIFYSLQASGQLRGVAAPIALGGVVLVVAGLVAGLMAGLMDRGHDP
jgi:hypothetical protein